MGKEILRYGGWCPLLIDTLCQCNNGAGKLLFTDSITDAEGSHPYTLGRLDSVGLWDWEGGSVLGGCTLL